MQCNLVLFSSFHRICAFRHLARTLRFSASNVIGDENVDLPGGIVSKVDINPDLHAQKRSLKPELVEDAKLLRVAIIGKTNSGKSVLTNALTGATVSAVSNKIHTTRQITQGICVNDKTQMIFDDTPGFYTGKRNRKIVAKDPHLFIDQEESLKSAELIVVLHDVSNKFACNRLDSQIMHLLFKYRHLPSVLVLNKIDLLKNRGKTLEIIYRLTKNRVNDKPLKRQQNKLEDVQDPTRSKYEKLDEIMKSYKTKRLSGEKPETSEQDLQPNDSTRSLQTAKNLIQSNKVEFSSENFSVVNQSKEKEPSAEHLNEEAVEYPIDRSLWPDVNWPSLLQIVKMPVHQVPISQLRKCFVTECGWPFFKAVFAVSALNGDGVVRLKDFFYQMAKVNAWKFHSSLVSPLSPIELAKETVRSKFYDILDKQIPYTLEYEVIVWEVNEFDTLNIFVEVKCQKHQVGNVLGENAAHLRIVGKRASQELSTLFGRDVYVKLSVKVLTNSEKPKAAKFVRRFRSKFLEPRD